MRLWIYAIGHMRGTPEGALCEDFCDRARKMGRNMGFSAVALEELPVSRQRDAQARKQTRKPSAQSDLLKRILTSLDDDKAENIVTIDLEGRSALCDAAVVASGRSSRHVSAMADHLARKLKEAGYGTRPINGQGQGDWVLVDAGDVIVHLFRPEVRDYYDLEGMWSVGGRK